MKYCTRYDYSTNQWLTGYYVGSRFYVIAKMAA